MDLSTYAVFGSGARVQQPTTARKLQCRDPRVVKKYQASLKTHYDTNQLVPRVFALETAVLCPATASAPLMPELAQEWEALDCLRLAGIRHAESNCRKLRTGKVPWTPALARALALHRFWDRFYTRSIGRHVSSSYLKRLASKAGVLLPQAMPLDVILRHRQESWENYKREKKRAPESRRSFLSNLAMA